MAEEHAGRVMQQPRKDTLRECLRLAADRIEALQARIQWWEEHFEAEVADAIADRKVAAGVLFLVGVAIGALAGAGLVAVLA